MPIVKALVRPCEGRVRDWPQLLTYALWANMTTHNSVTGFMSNELMTKADDVYQRDNHVMDNNVVGE